MKVNRIKVISRPLLPLLPSFAQRGSLLYHVSANGLLKGLCFEGSDFDKDAFYLEAFFLPLYVPQGCISFAFGDRLSKGKRWKMEEGKSAAIEAELIKAVCDEAIPFFAKADTPEGFARLIPEIHPNPRDPYVLQGRAYSWAKVGNVSVATGLLKELIEVLTGTSPQYDWMIEMAARAEKLSRLLTEDPAAAKQLLIEWESLSRKNLKLN